MAKGDPWRDKERLWNEYVENEKSRQELADMWGCSPGTIQYWQDKHNIPTRDNAGLADDPDYRDEEVLIELYHNQGKSLSEVADELDCSVFAVQRWMDKHNIETRQAPQDPLHPAHHGFHSTDSPYVGSTYEYVSTWIDGKNYGVPVHRLIAVSHGKLSPSDFWNPELDVHHKSGHGLDNRPENLEVMGRGEHTKQHEPWLYRGEIGEH